MFRAEIGIEKGGFLGQTVGYFWHFHKRLILFFFLLAGCIELTQHTLIFIKVPVAVASLTAYPVAGETVRVKVAVAVRVKEGGSQAAVKAIEREGSGSGEERIDEDFHSLSVCLCPLPFFSEERDRRRGTEREGSKAEAQAKERGAAGGWQQEKRLPGGRKRGGFAVYQIESIRSEEK